MELDESFVEMAVLEPDPHHRFRPSPFVARNRRWRTVRFERKIRKPCIVADQCRWRRNEREWDDCNMLAHLSPDGLVQDQAR